MFENIYGFSCVENQVLAQLKLSGMDITDLYRATDIDFGTLFNEMIIKGKKPEYFSLVPKIQDILKKIGIISFELKTTVNIAEVFDSLLVEKIFIKVKPEFVKNKLYARGLRPDHYVLIEKNGGNYTLYNDIPEINLSITEQELLNIYDGNYFSFKIIRKMSEFDYKILKKNFYFAKGKIKLPILVKKVEGITDIGVKLRNFLWIYKTIFYRFTECHSSVLDFKIIEEKRNLIDNIFARVEYLKIKRTNDIEKYCDLIKQVFNIDSDIRNMAENRSA